VKPGTKLAEQIAAATGGRADALVKELVVSATKSAADVAAKPADRVAAIQQLRLGRFVDLQTPLTALLGPTQPAEVQTAALGTLASFPDSAVATLLIQQWPSLSPRVRSQAADVLFSRPEWIVSLLQAVQKDEIGTGDVDPGRWKLLADHRDPRVRQHAAGLLAKLQTGRRGEVLEAYKDTITMSGDAPRGKEVFKKICAACHQLEGVGHPTGPNLAAMKNRGAEAILLNVLDPNREVNPQYLNYILVTTDGRSLTGMITAETATSVTLKRADNATDTVLRIDIDQLKSTGISLMPEGMEKQIDKQAMADILAYLKLID
jgi:putative heme-binding domain-containing protein